MKFPEELFRKATIISVNGEEIPAGTIFCVGRNYRKHLEELNSKDLGEPIIFTKPVTALFQDNGIIPLPRGSADVHHEVELAVIIGKTGKNILQADAPAYIAGAAVALDLTMRDVQDRAKKNGTPWTIAKGFDFSCPISKAYPVTDLNILSGVDLFLEKNGSRVQHGNTANMIFPIDYLIAHISGYFTLNPGDIILTGTPEGVGPIRNGDELIFWSSFSEKVYLCFSQG